MIRPAREADLEEVLALERTVRTAPHWSAAAYVCCLSGAGGARVLLLAHDEAGRLLGFAAGAVAAGEGELETVVVAADARRRGLGQELCAAVLAWCVGQGAQSVRLEVRASNVGAIRLYKRLGFQGAGRRPGYYRQPDEDALVMLLKLAGTYNQTLW